MLGVDQALERGLVGDIFCHNTTAESGGAMAFTIVCS
jgi:predicted outer membrane repeat protein